MNTVSTISAGDTAWVLVSTALVMLMVPGLALFYGGLVRGKNALNSMMMSLAPLGIVTVQWVLIGYSLSFAPGNRFLGGLSFWGFNGVGGGANPTYAATIPHVAFAMFQAMFAIITVALISGAVVERMRFPAYLAFGVAWTTLVYDPLAHWVWGDGGWLRTLGALDFAGGTVVHVSAGTAALVAAMVLGKRHVVGRAPLVPHSVPFTLFGAGLLWFGWFGFNAGSALTASDLAALAFASTHAAAAAGLTAWVLIDLMRTGKTTAVGAATGAVIGLVAITPAAGFVSTRSGLLIGALAALAFASTHAAAAAGLTAWVLIDLARTGKTTAVGAATGAVIGLVAITPAAGFVSTRSGLLIGALAAVASYTAMQIRARTTLDDTLDVFACHGVAGIFGAILTGVFASKVVNPAGADGLMHGGGFHQVGVQALAVLVTMVLSGGLTAGILVALQAMMKVRSSIASEVIGLDSSEHGEEAYHAGDLGEMGGSAGALGHGVVLIRPGVPKRARGVA